MVKRTHLDLSVKCGSSPVLQPAPEQKTEGSWGTVFNFLLALHVIISLLQQQYMTKMCSIICFILQAAELRLNQDALLNKREWGILFSDNNKRAEGYARGLKYKSVKISYNATRPSPR